MEDCVQESENFMLRRNFKSMESKEDIDKEKHGEGGILNNFISNSVTPTESTSEGDGGEEGKVADFGIKNGGGNGDLGASGSGTGGGMIDSLISSIFHNQSYQKAMESEEVSNKAVGQTDDAKVKEGEGGSNVVSHLPNPVPAGDELVPEVEEASILLHSIVHE